MDNNLTDKQLQALRWIIEQVSNDTLQETFLVISVATLGDPEGILVDGVKDTPTYVNLGALHALITSGIIIADRTARSGIRFTLTKAAYERAAFDFDNPEPDPIRSYLQKTLRLIPTAFEPDEFKGVCFDLSINAEWELGDKKNWPTELLLYLYRRNRLHELPAVLREHRPGINWSPYPGQ